MDFHATRGSFSPPLSFRVLPPHRPPSPRCFTTMPRKREHAARRGVPDFQHPADTQSGSLSRCWKFWHADPSIRVIAPDTFVILLSFAGTRQFQSNGSLRKMLVLVGSALVFIVANLETKLCSIEPVNEATGVNKATKTKDRRTFANYAQT